MLAWHTLAVLQGISFVSAEIIPLIAVGTPVLFSFPYRGSECCQRFLLVPTMPPGVIKVCLMLTHLEA